MLVLSYLILQIVTLSALSQQCNVRVTSSGRVCVCNSTYCDFEPKWKPVAGHYSLYTTSKERPGFSVKTNEFSYNRFNSEYWTVQVDVKAKKQKILGWGGAFTDATGINIHQLPQGAQDNLLRSYFGEDGVDYSLCRVPIGGTDFSTRPYSYDDHLDGVGLPNFKLQEEDKDHKIPVIEAAKKLKGGNSLKLFATAWTAPPWMKTNNGWTGFGRLKDEFYQLWADYHVKFFEAYRQNGIEFWGMTTGNEPSLGFVPNFLSKLNAMSWMSFRMNKWVGDNLGPTIRSSNFSHLKIMLHDDIKVTLPVLRTQLRNPTTVDFADGVAVHWYWEKLLPDSVLDLTVSPLKDLFLLATEASNGYLHGLRLEKAVELGSWPRAVNYIKSIFLDISYRSAGWIDWNMVLDQDGGPCYINNNLDAPIIINSAAGEFYKQPMFYALGHFAKFCPPDSTILENKIGWRLENIQAMSCLRPDDSLAVFLFNSGDRNVSLFVSDGKRVVEETVEADSINTFLWSL